MKQTAPWWTHAATAKAVTPQFMQHLLPLFVTWRQDGEARQDVLSGWLFVHGRGKRGLVLWITAGHVIRQIEQMRSDTRIKDLQAWWWDAYPHPDAGGIPLNLNGLSMFQIDAQGVDIGVARVSPLFAANLGQNEKLRPITVDMWQHKDRYRPRGFFVVGFPASDQTVQRRRRGGGIETSTSLTVRSIPLKKIKSKPKRNSLDEFWGHPAASYGQLIEPIGASEPNPSTLRGMSGGPVFSVRRKGRGIHYHLWGIQSAELGSSKFIRITPIEVLQFLLNKATVSRKQPAEQPSSVRSRRKPNPTPASATDDH